jgi:glucose/arabinose dehydrogenase
VDNQGRGTLDSRNPQPATLTRNLQPATGERAMPQLLTFIGVLLAGAVAGGAEQTLPLDRITLPPGFRIDVYATGVANARSMALSPSGVLFVGTRTAGNVYAVVDTDHDHRADRVHTIASGLNMPNGVAFRDGALYVAEVDRIWRYDDIERHLENPPKPTLVSDRFPGDRHHGWKFIRFGPDGLLYVPVGAPCNICEPDARHAAIFRMKPDGTGLEPYVTGVRNTVGFDWHPDTKELWFTDNGRDMLGDDLPPDELNHVTRQGQNFGYPYCHAGEISDPDFGSKHACSEFEPPARKLGPHVAAIGMRFYTGTMFPPAYRHQIFIAEHGSWNRTKKIGYRVSLVTLDASGRATSYEPFARGWLQDEKAWGRPADVQVMPDGALLVSDDQAGVIYRISYKVNSR